MALWARISHATRIWQTPITQSLRSQLESPTSTRRRSDPARCPWSATRCRRKKQFDPNGFAWNTVLAATGQPARFE